MEAKALEETLAEGKAEAEFKTIGDTLVKLKAYKEDGQTTRGHASSVVEKVDKLGDTRPT